MRAKGYKRFLWPCLVSYILLPVVQAKSSAWLSPNLLPESLPSAALDQAQFGLLNAKADFALGTASSLRGSQASSLLSQEIGADADVQEMRPDRHGLAMSLRHQAQLELAQATADEAAAEAVAADELRKADEAMLRAKALSKALAKGEAEELMDILKAPFSPVQDLVSDSKAILLSTETAVLEAPEEAAGNSTEAAARSCDPTVGLSCRAQRIITFDYRLSMGAGYAEWAAVVTLWASSLWIACCVCNCGLQQICLCQCWTCASLAFFAVVTITTVLKGT